MFVFVLVDKPRSAYHKISCGLVESWAKTELVRNCDSAEGGTTNPYKESSRSVVKSLWCSPVCKSCMVRAVLYVSMGLWIYGWFFSAASSAKASFTCMCDCYLCRRRLGLGSCLHYYVFCGYLLVVGTCYRCNIIVVRILCRDSVEWGSGWETDRQDKHWL